MNSGCERGLTIVFPRSIWSWYYAVGDASDEAEHVILKEVGWRWKGGGNWQDATRSFVVGD
jgi:hypothetical protein